MAMNRDARRRAVDHEDMLPLVAKSFEHHSLKKGPGYSWRMGAPNDGHYHFRVTWSPGTVTISGDLGNSSYSAWPSFGTLWGALDLIKGAGFDYLTGKSTHSRKFDRVLTADDLIRMANEEAVEIALNRRQQILEHASNAAWVRDPEDGNLKPEDFQAAKAQIDAEDGETYPLGSLSIRLGRKEDPHRPYPLWEKLSQQVGRSHHLMGLASARRIVKEDLAEHLYDSRAVYELGIDDYYGAESYGSEARWHYEALQLWARTMYAKEPLWHRMWRGIQRQRRAFKDLRRNPPIFRPVVYQKVRSQSYERYWRRVEWPTGGVSYRSLYPWKPYGIDLSRVGFWRDGGSNSPVRTPRDEEQYQLLDGRQADTVAA